MEGRMKKETVSPLETLPMKGVYTLVIFLSVDSRVRVHRLGDFNFQKGYYAYTGSALGSGATSLRRRVARHLKKRKNRQWHIDFLLTNRKAEVKAVVAAESGVNEECHINNLIKKIEGATVPLAGFGASDCRKDCESHLLYLGEENVHERIVDVYVHLFGSEQVSSIHV